MSKNTFLHLAILFALLCGAFCSNERVVRVSAVETVLVYNDGGDHDPDGRIYTLTENAREVEQIRVDYLRAIQNNDPHAFNFKPHNLVRPLTLRCSVGETLLVDFTNRISGREVGMHLYANFYDNESDGTDMNGGADSLVSYGDSHTYKWHCRREGVFLIHDMGDIRGSEAGTQIHGLFASLVVEREGAIWTDPHDVKHRYIRPDNILYADIHPSGLHHQTKTPWLSPPSRYHAQTESFREFVVYFHDEAVLNKNPFVPLLENPCGPPPCPVQTVEGINDVGTISYRSEPLEKRIQDALRKLQDPDYVFSNIVGRGVYGEEVHHSSWVFGDPATPIVRAYTGDPTRVHVVHAGVKETHVFHLHHYQWHLEHRNYDSPVIDSKSVSPGNSHTFDVLYGAGTRVGTACDVIWHCHLYPHFDAGMWGAFRTFDTYHVGQDFYPNGVPIEPLAALPDREPPPWPTAERPGFPNYIPGTPGQKSPNPPYPTADVPPELDYRPPTQLELNAMNEFPEPGALFQKFSVGRPGTPVVKSRFSVVKAPHVMNKYGWINKEHTFYIPDDELDTVTPDVPKAYKPMVLHCNNDSILEIHLTNRLPRFEFGTEFSVPVPICAKPVRGWNEYSGEVSTHSHLVKFDPLTSDGASVGWNYITGVSIGKTMIYRMWIDERFTGVFFHDHLFAATRQRKGLYAALAIHPTGSAILDPHTFEVQNYKETKDGLELVAVNGLHQVIATPDGMMYREFGLAVGDFMPAWDRNDRPLNPPVCPGGVDDPGVMSLNYRSTPISERVLDASVTNRDPRFWFSSEVHGDPDTTIFETFPGDQIRFTYFQGSHEEPHSLQVNGMRWREFSTDPGSYFTNVQVIGISELYRLNFDHHYGAGDHMYRLTGVDDTWLGCWGIIRSYDKNEPTQLKRLEMMAGLPDPFECSPERDPVRRYWVTARSVELTYFQNDTLKLSDPYARIYEVTGYQGPEDKQITWIAPELDQTRITPAVLRCKQGELVEITLINKLDKEAGPEPYFAQTPLDIVRPFEVVPRSVAGVFHYLGNRPVSNHVSIHLDLLEYDVRDSDGYNVGRNNRNDQTAPPGGEYTYRFCIDPEMQTGSTLITDGADYRYNKHHGLVGALIVEPKDNCVFHPVTGLTSLVTGNQTIINTYTRTLEDTFMRQEIVVVHQDGLRLYENNDLTRPRIDFVANDYPTVQAQDQGQKGFNYRAHPVRNSIKHLQPYTPVFHAQAGLPLDLHIVGGGEKPRLNGFHVHGHSWSHMGKIEDDIKSVHDHIAPGGSWKLEIHPVIPGRWVYRSSNFASGIEQGLWGIIDVPKYPLSKGRSPRFTGGQRMW